MKFERLCTFFVVNILSSYEQNRVWNYEEEKITREYNWYCLITSISNSKKKTVSLRFCCCCVRLVSILCYALFIYYYVFFFNNFFSSRSLSISLVQLARMKLTKITHKPPYKERKRDEKRQRLTRAMRSENSMLYFNSATFDARLAHIGSFNSIVDVVCKSLTDFPKCAASVRYKQFSIPFVHKSNRIGFFRIKFFLYAFFTRLNWFDLYEVLRRCKLNAILIEKRKRFENLVIFFYREKCQPKMCR